MNGLAMIVVALELLGASAALAREARDAATPTTTPPPNRLESQARDLVSVVSRLRDLAVRHPVSMGVLDRDAIMAEVSRRLAEDYSEEEVQAEAAVLERLGLLPPGLSYKQAILELLTDQVAGFYDPERKRLNIASWLPLVLQKPTLVHEICHALQDQHFDLRMLIKPARDQGDRQLAHAALVEGDCTGTMLEYVLAPSGLDLSHVTGEIESLLGSVLLGSGSDAFRRAPMFLRETLTFPYLYGLRFVQKVRAARGWRAVSELLRRPPSTTEQILHFDKFERREAGAALRLRKPKALGAYELLKEDTLGEFQISIYLRQAVSREEASRASAGWGGDRLAAYRRRGTERGPVLILQLTRWDSEADAVEFRDAQRRVLSKLAGRELQSERPDRYVARAGELRWTVEQRGVQVISTMAAPEGVHEQVLAR